MQKSTFMNIQIERTHRTADYIDGTLRIDSIDKICDTAEHAASALPAGTYPVIIHRCKHYRRKMPIISRRDAETTEDKLQNSAPLRAKEPDCDHCPKMSFVCNNSTLPRYCPQIKIGNGVYNRTDGSIIIGERIVWGALIHSADHFNRLIDRLDKAQNRGETITVTIKENYEP